MKLIRKFALSLAAFLGLAVAVHAAAIPLLTGPIDPSGLQGTLNQLIQSINRGVVNKLYANAVVSATSAGTGEETLYTYTLPANTLVNAGDGVFATCAAQGAATANNKTLKLYFGASVVTTGAVAANNSGLYLEARVIRGASATAQAFVGTGVGGTAGVTPIAVTNTAGTDNMAADIVIKCTGQNGTAALADTSGKEMSVQLVN